MSYDLLFWKQKPTCTSTPLSIYEALMEEHAVDDLETIPAAEFISRVHQQFPGIVTDGGLTYWDGGQRGMFEVYSSGKHVHFCCRQLSGEDMNTLIDIAAEFDCPLYDPQTSTRYDGSAS